MECQTSATTHTLLRVCTSECGFLCFQHCCNVAAADVASNSQYNELSRSVELEDLSDIAESRDGQVTFDFLG